MMRWIISMIVAGLCATGPAAAQNCDDPENQQAMNHCAWLKFESADRALNVAYKKARAFLRQMDANLSAELKGGEIALRAAQRAWVTFRDKACEADGFLFRGGSMEPLIVATCKTRLTKRRTGDLLGLLE